MYSGADVSVTPRPMYPADGRKLPDVNTHPPELRETLQKDLRHVPAIPILGPGAESNPPDGFAEAAIRVEKQFDPTLSLCYCLRRTGLCTAA